MKSQLTTLPSGLRIATCEMPHAETAAVGIWAGVGGRHEPSKLNGISHFIEHMLFKGTAKRSARRIMEEVEGVGGDMNAFTAEERTCYYAAAASEYFPRLCDVLADLYLNPRFNPVDIERERGVIGEEILVYQDEPASHVQEVLNENYWPNHALGRPLTGTVKTIGSFTREDFLAYRTSHYHAHTTVVSAARKIRHDEVRGAGREAAGRYPEGPQSARHYGACSAGRPEDCSEQARYAADAVCHGRSRSKSPRSPPLRSADSPHDPGRQCEFTPFPGTSREAWLVLFGKHSSLVFQRYRYGEYFARALISEISKNPSALSFRPSPK